MWRTTFGTFCPTFWIKRFNYTRVSKFSVIGISIAEFQLHKYWIKQQVNSKKNIFTITLYRKKKENILCAMSFQVFLRTFFHNHFKFFCHTNSFYSPFEEATPAISGENSRMVSVSYISILTYFSHINVYTLTYIRQHTMFEFKMDYTLISNALLLSLSTLSNNS